MNASVVCIDTFLFQTEWHTTPSRPRTQIYCQNWVEAMLTTEKASVSLVRLVAPSLGYQTHCLQELCASMVLIRVGWSPWIIIARIAIRRPHLCSNKRARRNSKISRMPPSGSRYCHQQSSNLLARGWLRRPRKFRSRLVMRVLPILMLLRKIRLRIKRRAAYKWFTRNLIWTIGKMSHSLMLFCLISNNKSKRTIFSHKWLLRLKSLEAINYMAKISSGRWESNLAMEPPGKSMRHLILTLAKHLQSKWLNWCTHILVLTSRKYSQ